MKDLWLSLEEQKQMNKRRFWRHHGPFLVVLAFLVGMLSAIALLILLTVWIN